ncbi:MAG: zinc ribbon domain-containing protein [Methanoregula sp.]|jgi:hypothetical protein
MPNFCPTCGKELQYENAEICPNCGVRIQPPPAPQPVPPKAEIRNPPAAVILSFLFTGWGQWYNGQTWEGLKFFGAFLVSYLLLFLFAVMTVSQPFAVPGVVLMVVVVLGIWVYAMYDAYKTAERINKGEVAFSEKSALFWLPIALIALAVLVIIAAVIAAFTFGMAAATSL